MFTTQPRNIKSIYVFAIRSLVSYVQSQVYYGGSDRLALLNTPPFPLEFGKMGVKNMDFQGHAAGNLSVVLQQAPDCFQSSDSSGSPEPLWQGSSTLFFLLRLLRNSLRGIIFLFVTRRRHRLWLLSQTAWEEVLDALESGRLFI